MTDIVIYVTLGGLPVNGLADVPTITIQRVDTGAEVVSDAAMIDRVTRGLYTFNFTPVAGLHYSCITDADPLATGQVDVRFLTGVFDNDLTDIWNDRGLNPSVPKTVTENAVGTDYDEDVASPTAIHKDTTKVGSVTTIDRT